MFYYYLKTLEFDFGYAYKNYKVRFK
jgi:hypothetical protein